MLQKWTAINDYRPFTFIGKPPALMHYGYERPIIKMMKVHFYSILPVKITLLLLLLAELYITGCWASQ